MSEVGDSARVTIIVADYATVDEVSKKPTVVGSGISVVGYNPTVTKSTAPLFVLAIATFDSKFVGARPIVELTLETVDGEIFEVQPGIDAPPGATSQPLRLKGGGEELLPTVLAGFHIPAEAVRPKVQMIMKLTGGLSLCTDQTYLWRVTIDGESRDEWTESMYVVDLSQGKQAN
ncbi:Uncharacterised protein [Mycobacteroides abscessus subsp. abscessus]|uniref:hypothetical protein n=1 Tax=Mycobacteroides abscessus TaxID=36809 RepID=UPI0009A6BFBA|nr:hypothetical protein [Mycobacteroides abscessus]MBL3743438.1 hypothetical protein [Mycobacteroides abscessus subsp. massiliense]RIR58221.1 hypothetical protein D2E37_08570 [Mycobacteroides abscessus]RIS86454.1 hypothetical protein D2E53_08570 [Mycobacteroides abscessus]SKF66829.1 Uncharacterised protein [Mycobacteroides abscessus subsp. bolletii]SKF71261.1 Uncharacterised protein [Mycobacteroides abscessus subsp. bolletii]